MAAEGMMVGGGRGTNGGECKDDGGGERWLLLLTLLVVLPSWVLGSVSPALQVEGTKAFQILRNGSISSQREVVICYFLGSKFQPPKHPTCHPCFLSFCFLFPIFIQLKFTYLC